jgi:DNA-directed RNA polymerase subunit omega
LPSKRARKIPEKIQILKEDLDELKTPSEPSIETSEATIETKNEQTEELAKESDVSLDELSDAETKSNEVNQEDSETSNS